MHKITNYIIYIITLIYIDHYHKIILVKHNNSDNSTTQLIMVQDLFDFVSKSVSSVIFNHKTEQKNEILDLVVIYFN
jgi:hypothetical protein